MMYFFARKNDTTAFSLISSLGGDFSVWSTASIPWNKGGERTAPTAGSKYSNPREDARIVKQNNPNNPSRAEALGNKEKKKSCLLLRHSWDRFIIQAKANFDKQLGVISLKRLGSSLSYSQSNQGVGAGGGLKVMKKCATNVPLRKKERKKKKDLLEKKNVSIIIKWDKLY